MKTATKILRGTMYHEAEKDWDYVSKTSPEVMRFWGHTESFKAQLVKAGGKVQGNGTSYIVPIANVTPELLALGPESYYEPITDYTLGESRLSLADVLDKHSDLNQWGAAVTDNNHIYSLNGEIQKLEKELAAKELDRTQRLVNLQKFFHRTE